MLIFLAVLAGISFAQIVNIATFENKEAHYIVLKNAQQHKTFTSKNLGGSGLNKQTIWVRNDVLEEWIRVSTSSCKNRKYFSTKKDNELGKCQTEIILFKRKPTTL